MRLKSLICIAIALHLCLHHAQAWYAKHAPSTVPATFRPAYEQSTVCNTAFYRINFGDSCQPVDLSGSSHAAGLSILLCPDTDAFTTGMVIFRDDDLTRSATTRIYRARLSGPEVLLLPIHYCTASLAVAPFSVTLPGTFSLELLQLYSAFTFHTVTPLLQDMHLATTQFTVDKINPKAVGSAKCVGAACPLCRTADTPGRWLVKQEAAGGLSKTCPPTPLGPKCHRDEPINPVPQRIDDSLMRWQPYGCSFHPHSDHLACLRRLQGVCFFGDSQIRHLYNGFVQPAFNLDASWDYTDKSRVEHPGASYTLMTWGYDLHADNLTNCSSVVANFGQWPLAHTSQTVVNGTVVKRPWTAGEFIHRLAHAAHVLQDAQQQGKRVWWVTINSHPYISWFTNMTDFRTDPYLLLFNNIAYEVMHRHGVPVIDTWTMTDTLKDLAYDRAHFKGWVGHWAAAAVAHEVCADGRSLDKDVQMMRKLQRRRFHCHWQEYSMFLSARSGHATCLGGHEAPRKNGAKHGNL